jgi:hypothetical protein
MVCYKQKHIFRIRLLYVEHNTEPVRQAVLTAQTTVLLIDRQSVGHHNINTCPFHFCAALQVVKIHKIRLCCFNHNTEFD